MSEPTTQGVPSETPELSMEEKIRAASVLVRINARAWGVATGAVLGLGLFFATLILVWKGGTDVGANLGRLRNVLPFYTVSTGGAFLGLVYGFFIGYGLGRLFGPRRAVTPANGREASAENRSEVHVRLSPRSWSFLLGGLSALLLFLTTNVLALRGGADVGPLLRRLDVYFPGYSVDFIGSLIGSAYMLALGWIVGQCVAFVYNRAVARAEA
ncbi:MAG TPA: hypothetical protein VM509_05310 [Planctomycetota bacterium]|nr:hypothetical protein [Planctomycetota bacterium]